MLGVFLGSLYLSIKTVQVKNYIAVGVAACGSSLLLLLGESLLLSTLRLHLLLVDKGVVDSVVKVRIVVQLVFAVQVTAPFGELDDLGALRLQELDHVLRPHELLGMILVVVAEAGVEGSKDERLRRVVLEQRLRVALARRLDAGAAFTACAFVFADSFRFFQRMIIAQGTHKAAALLLFVFLRVQVVLRENEVAVRVGARILQDVAAGKETLMRTTPGLVLLPLPLLHLEFFEAAQVILLDSALLFLGEDDVG